MKSRSTMADPSRKSNRKKFTITATATGIETAERALIRLGFQTKTNFAKSHYISRSTVTKFFGRKPIQLDTFKKICQELKLNWRAIAGIEETQPQQSPKDTRVSFAEDSETEQMELSSSRQVTVIEPSSGIIKAEITLEGDINSVSNLKILETILREHSGNTIKIRDIQEGSIKLNIEGSREDIEKLVQRIKSGKLTQIDVFPVENIQILMEYSEGENSDIDSKWHLFQEIVNHPIRGRKLDGIDLSDTDLSYADLSYADLSYADLSGANLRGANLRGANLSDSDLSDSDLSYADLSYAYLSYADLSYADLSYANLRSANLSYANLSGANVEQATFGYNQGISESARRDLISRGAIFEDSQGSGDRSLVPTR